MSDPLSPHSSEIIELTYRGLEDDHYWMELLEAIRSRLQFTVAVLAFTYPGDGAISFHYCVGRPDTDVGAYVDNLKAQNPWRNQLIARQLPLGVILRAEELASEKESMAANCWRDFLGPKGAQYGFVALLAKQEDHFSCIHGTRAADLGPLTNSETEWIEGLLPHLVRAVSLHGRVARLQTERDALLAYSDSMETGIVLVGLNGNIRFANKTAEKILTAGQALVRRDGCLCTSNVAEEHRLEVLIRRVGSALPGDSRETGTMSISRPDAGPLILHVTLADSLPSVSVGPGVSSAIVWIVDPSAHVDIDPAPLQEMFGLTPSEARLCHELARGHSAKEIAAQWNVSITTIRTHLSHALEKTATRRQSELVTLTLRIANIPTSRPKP